MEEKLKVLLEGNLEKNRTKWALEWKRQGKKVIGLIAHNYIPEEILHAADILPWRITGSWQEGAPMAEAHRTKISCRYCTHILESFLQDEIDFLDGIIAVDLDDDVRTMWDVLDFYKKAPFIYMMHFPHKVSEGSVRYWLREIEELKKAIEQINGVKVTPEKIVNSIKVYNKTRELIGKLYEMRKRPQPPLTGAEMLAITCTAAIMPKEEFNKQLEELLPYIDLRKTQQKDGSLRILVSGDFLDDVRYLEAIETAGCVVAMDDLDTGSRYMLGSVEESMYNPEYRLAQYYIDRPGTNPHMYEWDKQTENIVKWVAEYKIDGVVELPAMYSFPREFMTPFFKNKIEEKGIPFISLRRDYGLSNTGQLSTRIGAFFEMIKE